MAAIIVLIITMACLWPIPGQAQTIVPGSPSRVGTFPPVIEASAPNAREILLDVAASHPFLLIQLHTQEDIINLNIDPFVRIKMIYAIAYGSWVLTTRTPVTSGKWTGRPWLAFGGHTRYFYFAYESGTPWDGYSDISDQGGALGSEAESSGKGLSDFGKSLTESGLAIAAIGQAKGNKAVTAFGLSLAGIGMALNAVGLAEQIAKDALSPSPKQGHVDTEPTGMPSSGGPPGSDPNGPTGASPPGIGQNGNGNAPSGGISGTGGDGEGGVGDPGDD